MRFTFWFMPCQHWNDKFVILCHSLSFLLTNFCHTLFGINSQTLFEQIASKLTESSEYMLAAESTNYHNESLLNCYY